MNVSRIVRLGFRLLTTIDSFEPFQHFRPNRLSANPSSFPSLTGATVFGTALASERGAMLRTNCEAVMWKITTRGFALEEVLIMAAMNLLISADTDAKRKTPHFKIPTQLNLRVARHSGLAQGLAESAACCAETRSLTRLAVVAAACTSALMASRNLAAAAPRRQRRAPARAQLFPECLHRKAFRSG
jgi:hypothetical protein